MCNQNWMLGWISLAACDLLTSPASSWQVLIAQCGRSYRGTLCLCSSKVSSSLGYLPRPYQEPWHKTPSHGHPKQLLWVSKGRLPGWRSQHLTYEGPLSSLVCLKLSVYQEGKEGSSQFPSIAPASPGCLIQRQVINLSGCAHSHQTQPANSVSLGVAFLTLSRTLSPSLWLQPHPSTSLHNWPPAQFPFFGFISCALSSLPSAQTDNSVIKLQSGMYKTVTHVIRYEGNPLRHGLHCFSFPIINGYFWVLKTFQFNWKVPGVHLLYICYTPTHLLCVQRWPGWSKGWTDGLGCCHLKDQQKEFLICNCGPLGLYGWFLVIWKQS